jgi:Icc-related predicted phosphoesterase
MDNRKATVRLAAVGDLHYTRTSHGTLQPLCAQITESADMLLLCGDIIDYGAPEEARLFFTKELTTAVKIPILTVFGNHEYECGKQEEVRQIFTDAGILVLDGEAHEVYGIGFAGVKGFAGGFGEYALQAWGEETGQPSALPCFIIPRCARPWKASRRKSLRFSALAAWRNR